jgi:uncharacterized protein YbjT (DUF2867 family)
MFWSVGSIKDHGAFYQPMGDARQSQIDVRDIAAVAVTVLRDPATHSGQTYTVTGPEATSPREQVEILADVLERPLAAEEVTIEQAQQAMLEQGWPAWGVERMGELFRLYADGLATEVSPDVERVTGRAARTYRQFATDHREAFLAR